MHPQNERRILLDLDHPFVVKLFGTFQDPKRIYFVMEFIVGGELFSRLSKKAWLLRMPRPGGRNGDP